MNDYLKFTPIEIHQLPPSEVQTILAETQQSFNIKSADPELTCLQVTNASRKIDLIVPKPIAAHLTISPATQPDFVVINFTAPDCKSVIISLDQIILVTRHPEENGQGISFGSPIPNVNKNSHLIPQELPNNIILNGLDSLRVFIGCSLFPKGQTKFSCDSYAKLKI